LRNHCLLLRLVYVTAGTLVHQLVHCLDAANSNHVPILD